MTLCTPACVFVCLNNAMLAANHSVCVCACLIKPHSLQSSEQWLRLKPQTWLQRGPSIQPSWLSLCGGRWVCLRRNLSLHAWSLKRAAQSLTGSLQTEIMARLYTGHLAAFILLFECVWAIPQSSVHFWQIDSFTWVT